MTNTTKFCSLFLQHKLQTVHLQKATCSSKFHKLVQTEPPQCKTSLSFFPDDKHHRKKQ